MTIVSDLHLGSGFNAEKGEYARMEEFFYDYEFSLFIDKIIMEAEQRARPHTLILNGDIFDFLSVNEVPSEAEAEQLGITLTAGEKKYGLGSSETRAVWKVRKILGGHPVFLQSLARFLLRGHEIIYIRGNHDLDLYWKGVRSTIQQSFRAVLIELGSSDGQEVERLVFRPWFHLIENEIYVEHGHQYDETNAITANLNPLLPEGSYGSRERLLDYPIGSLFARFVYAPIRSVDPYRIHVISFTQYLSVIRGFNIWQFIRTVHLNFPFFVRSVRNSISYSAEGLKNVMEKHEQRMHRYSSASRISIKTLRRIDRLRERPLGHSMHNIFLETFKPILKKMIWVGVLSILSIYGWIFIFTALSSVLSHSVFGRASVISVLAVLTVMGLFALLTKVGKALEGYQDPLVEKSYIKACKIAKIMNVKHVVMGHTHVIHQRTIKGRGKYLNTGTWILFPGPWDNLQAQARQFTFATYRDGVLSLKKWNPSLREFVPPMVLSDEAPGTLVTTEKTIR
ncbi:metallophosphoesterase [Myxococcota bacterium]|nr:metallophosphoesterase [Myxococcota bacterium]